MLLAEAAAAAAGRLAAGLAPRDLPPPATPAAEARRAAEAILARPEFREPPRSLYQRLLDRLGEVVGEVLGALVGGGLPAVAAWVVVGVLSGAAAYLVVRGLRLDRRARRGGTGEGLSIETRRPAADWEGEAAAHEARGEWRAALRCRYRALVARLAGAGVVEEVPGRTTGDYSRVVGRAAPTVAAPFSAATELFERAWYGGQPTGPDESSEFGRLAGRVLEGAP